MSKPGALRAFFRNFPAFVYNPKLPAETEFCRLWESRRWGKSSPEFKTIRRHFLKAVVKETDSPVHRFFVNGYESFDYDSEASPRRELERLRLSEKWHQSSPSCVKAKALFETAFEKDFNGKVDIFFRQFGSFDYNPRSSFKREFERLKELMGWRGIPRNLRESGAYKKSEKDKAYDKASYEFFRAFADGFDTHFGTDENDVGAWKLLCRSLEVDYEPVPTTIGQCKGRVEEVYVNIYDFDLYMRTKTPFEFFASEKELGKYSKDNHLVYPLDEAKFGPMKFPMRYLLRVILLVLLSPTHTYKAPIHPSGYARHKDVRAN